MGRIFQSSGKISGAGRLVLILACLLLLSIPISALAAAPSVDLDPDNSGGNQPGFAASFTENNGAVKISDTDASVSDIDSANLDHMNITITNVKTADVLNADVTATSISKSYNSGTGVLLLSGSDTIAHYQTVLRSVTFENTSENPDTTARAIDIIANDGTIDSAAVSSTISVTAVNDAPSVDLDPDNSGGNQPGFAAGFTENGGAVKIEDTDAAISDPDTANISSMTVTITNVQPDDTLDATPAGSITKTYHPTTGILELSGTDTQANYRTVLRSVTFDNTSNNPVSTARTITFAADDGLGNGASATCTLSITTSNDPPVMTPAGPFSISEHAAENDVVATVSATDIDDDESSLTFSIVSGNGAGFFQINANTGAISVTAAGESGLDFETTSSYTLGITASDSTDTSAAENYTIDLTDDNDAPVLTPASPSMTSITEDDTSNGGMAISAVIGGSVSDQDAGAAFGIAIYSQSPGNGTWQVSLDAGASWSNTGTVNVNQALLLRDVDLVRFLPDEQNSDSANFSYYAWDQTQDNRGNKVDVTARGNPTAFSTSGDTATIAVSAVNDAPVLDNSGDMALTSIAEDTLSPAGDGISSVIVSAGGDRITDVDTGAVEGIAVIGVDNTNGIWQYDAGSGWTAFGAVNDSAAILLAASDSIRFVPAADWYGTAEISFRAWDQTSGSSGASADTTINGGVTSFSNGTESAQITVTPVNDYAPAFTGNPSMTDVTGCSSGPSGDRVSDMINGIVTDADGDTPAIAVTAADNTNGTWQYDAGSGWSSFGALSDNSATLLSPASYVRFVPTSQWNGDASITIRAWDQSSGSNGDTGVDVSVNGDPTAYSASTRNAVVHVTPCLVINGFNFDPAGSDAGNEWIELFAKNDVNVNNWQVTDQDGHTYTLPNASLSAGEFIKIFIASGINDLSGPVKSVYTGINEEWLDNGGDDILLYNASGDPADYIAYGSGGSVDPVPAGTSWSNNIDITYYTEGNSFGLDADGNDEDHGDNWVENPAPSPNIVISKTGPSEIMRGNTTGQTYTITIKNNGGGPAYGVSVIDDYPADFTINSVVSVTKNGSTTGYTATDDTPAAGEMTFSDLPNLLPDETLVIKISMSAACSAVIGVKQNIADVEFHENPDLSDAAISRQASADIEVLKGTIKTDLAAIAVNGTAIAPTATPKAAVGDVITFRATVMNTGSGDLFDVTSETTWGAGLSYQANLSCSNMTCAYDAGNNKATASASMIAANTEDNTYSYVFDLSVDACEGITATATGDEKCHGPGELTSGVEVQIKNPDISYTISPSPITLPYGGSQTVVMDISNNGDGKAYNFKLDSGFEGYSVTISNVSSGFSYDGGTGIFSYSSAFSPNNIPGDRATLSFDLSVALDCANRSPSGTVIFDPDYTNSCDKHFYAPRSYTTFSTGSAPDVSITKTSSSGTYIAVGDTVSYSLTLGVTSPDGISGDLTITDNVPSEIEHLPAALNPSAGTASITGNTITWTVSPQNADNATLDFSGDVKNDPCLQGTTITNSASVSATDTLGCSLSDSSPRTIYINNNPDNTVVQQKNSSNALETCNSTGIVITNDYDIGTGVAGTWQDGGGNSIFSDDLHSGSFCYITNSAQYNFDTDDTAGESFSGWTAVPSGSISIDGNGALVIDLSFLAAIDQATGGDANVGGNNLEIRYSIYAYESKLSGADSVTWDSLSDIFFNGNTGSCTTSSGHYVQHLLVDVRRASLLLGIDIPSVLEDCGTYNATITVGQNTPVDFYDLVVSYDTAHYEYLGGLSTSGFNGKTPSVDTVSVPGKVIFSFDSDAANPDTLTQGGTLTFSVRKKCGTAADIAASATYNSRLDTSATANSCGGGDCGNVSRTVNAADSPILSNSGDLILNVTPEDYPVSTTDLTWKMYVANRGSGTSYNSHLKDVLGPNLQYVSSTVDGAASSPTIQNNTPAAGFTTITWNLGDIPASTTNVISIAAATTGYSCNLADTNSTIDVDWGCGGGFCQTISGIALPNFSHPSTEAIAVNTIDAPFDLCGSGSLLLKIKNTGSAHVYNAKLIQDLKSTGMVYKAGTAEVSVDGNTWSATNDPSSAGATLTWQGSNNTGSDYVSELADIPDGSTVYIRFDLASECSLPQNPEIEASGSYQQPCQVGSADIETIAGQIRTMPFNEPAPRLTLDLRNVSTGGPFTTGNVYAEKGDTVEYKISIANDSNVSAIENASLRDVLPANLSFVSITAQNTEAGGVTGGASPEWTIEDIDANDTDVYIISATVTNCDAAAENTAQLKYGCAATADYAACQSFSETGYHGLYGKLYTRPGVDMSTAVSSSAFTTCGGQVTIRVKNSGAVTRNIDYIKETLPESGGASDGWVYDPSGGGATITFDVNGADSTGSHTITTEEPDLSAGAHKPNWNTLNGNIDFLDTDETVTIVYHVKADGNYCDTNLSADPTPALPVSPSIATDIQIQDSCGNTYITSNTLSLSPTYPDVDIAITPASQLVTEGGTAAFTITLTNNGTAAAKNLSLVLDLGNGFTITAAGNGGTIDNAVDPRTVTWTDGNINGGGGIGPGGTWTVDVSANVGSGSLAVYSDVDGLCHDAGGASACTHSHDRAYATVAGISYKKEIFSVNEPGAITDAPVNQNANATIGNVVVFDITAKLLGEGTYQDFIITDTLPAGLVFVSGASPDLAQMNGNNDAAWTDIPTDGTYSAPDGGITAKYTTAGSTYTFTIDADGAGPVTFDVTAGNAPKYVQIRLRARVDDVAGNTAGTSLSNASYTDFVFDNGNGVSYALDHTAEADLNSNSTIIVTEPDLSAVKYYPGWTGDPDNLNIYDTVHPKEVAVGETIDYTLAFSNNGAAGHSQAFDVVANDVIPYGMRIDIPVISDVFIEDDGDYNKTTGTVRSLASGADYVFAYNSATGAMTITLDNGANGNIANTNIIGAGEDLVIKYTTKVDTNAGVGITLDNNADADYSTIRGTPVAPETNERTYTISAVTTKLSTGETGITKASALNGSVVYDGRTITYSLTFPDPVQDVFMYGDDDGADPHGNPEFSDTLPDGLEITDVGVTINPTRVCDVVGGTIYIPPFKGHTSTCGDAPGSADDRAYNVALSTVGAGTRNRKVDIDFNKFYPGDFLTITITAETRPTFDDTSAIDEGHVFTNDATITIYSKPSSEPARVSNTYTSNQVTATYSKLINITPDRSGQTTPGTWIKYEHTVNNMTGHDEDVCFSFASSKGWNWFIVDSSGNILKDGATTNPLSVSANNSENIFIRYFVPTNVSNGTVEATDILMHPYDAVTCHSGTIYDTVTDTTIIQSASLRLVKSVRKCLKTDMNNCGVFSGSNTADPCDYLEYHIEFKNMASSGYKGLTISDIIPDHTAFTENAYGAAQDVTVHMPDNSTIYKDITVSGGSFTVDLSSDIPVLAPGEEGWIQYKVKINGNGCP